MYQLCKTSDKSVENYHKNKKNKFIIIVVNFAINGQPQVICHSCMFSSGCQEQDLIGHFQSRDPRVSSSSGECLDQGYSGV